MPSAKKSQPASRPDFILLPAYARYLRDERLTEFSTALLTVSKAADVPLLRFFKDVPDEQLIAMGLVRNKELLTLLSECRFDEILESSTAAWTTNQLPMIQREQVVTEDIIKVSFTRRKVFRDMLGGYTKDAETFRQIMEEVDRFSVMQDTRLFNTYIQIQQKEINSINVALQSRERELLEAQEIAQIGSFEWDLTGKNSRYTPEVFSILGMEQSSTLPSFMEDVHPDDREKLSTAIAKGIKEGIFDCEYRYVRNNKEKVIWSRGKGTFEGDKVIRILGTIMDVTERNKIISRLEKSEELYRKANEALEAKNQELERSNKELESFNFVASHDLKEPLRKIRMFSDKLMDASADFPESARGYLQKMNLAAGRMQKLIDDLLAFSESSSDPTAHESTDLGVLIKEIQFELATLIEEKQAVITADGLPIVQAIPFQMKQLLSNLISNSLKYGKANVPPVVTISASLISGDNQKDPDLVPDKSYHSIAVTDNGIGFDQKHAKKIFELFQRLHTKDKYSGTGIGLAICKKILDNHGGLIRAQSKEGVGTEITVFLPK